MAGYVALAFLIFVFSIPFCLFIKKQFIVMDDDGRFYWAQSNLYGFEREYWREGFNDGWFTSKLEDATIFKSMEDVLAKIKESKQIKLRKKQKKKSLQKFKI